MTKQRVAWARQRSEGGNKMGKEEIREVGKQEGIKRGRLVHIGRLKRVSNIKQK